MDTKVEKLVSNIVDSITAHDFTLQKQFFLTQSLLALARAAHATGYKNGCQDTIKEINRQIDSANALYAHQIGQKSSVN